MSFEQAVAKVLDHEGGFVDDPADRGGMTFMGISRRWFPDEPLWEKIDALLSEGRNPNEAMDELRDDVKDLPCCGPRKTQSCSRNLLQDKENYGILFGL